MLICSGSTATSSGSALLYETKTPELLIWRFLAMNSCSCILHPAPWHGIIKNYNIDVNGILEGHHYVS